MINLKTIHLLMLTELTPVIRHASTSSLRDSRSLRFHNRVNRRSARLVYVLQQWAVLCIVKSRCCGCFWQRQITNTTKLVLLGCSENRELIRFRDVRTTGNTDSVVSFYNASEFHSKSFTSRGKLAW